MLETRIAGIPCLVKVIHYYHQEPDYGTWDSDMDFYGYTECDYEIYDRKGYRAKWLESKMTSADNDRIVGEVAKSMQPV